MNNRNFRSVVSGALVGLMLGIVSVVGCGGAPDDQDESSDIGQADQTMSAPRTNTYVLGASQASSGLRCTRTNATQVCNAPTTRVMKWCNDNLTGPETQYASFLSVARDSGGHFTWTLNPATGAACQAAMSAGTVNVMVNAANNICPSGTTNIDSIVCGNPTVTTAQMTESPSVPGSFFGSNGGIVHIDRAHLLAFSTSQSDRDLAAQHGVAHQGLRFVGIGARTDHGGFGAIYWSNRSVLPLTGTVGRTLTTGENCTLANYSSVLSPGIYAQDSTSCSTD